MNRMALTLLVESYRFSYFTGGSGSSETEVGLPEYDSGVAESTWPCAGLSRDSASALPMYSSEALLLLRVAVAKTCCPQSTGTR